MNPNCCSTESCEAPAPAPPAETQDRALGAIPPVDVVETQAGVTLWADLPGVSAETLEITVENGLLIIGGKATLAARGNAVHDEFAPADYLRRFQLGPELNQENIAAELKNGVLKLFIPKTEKAKPRRIEIKSE